MDLNESHKHFKSITFSPVGQTRRSQGYTLRLAWQKVNTCECPVEAKVFLNWAQGPDLSGANIEGLCTILLFRGSGVSDSL